MIDKSFPLRNGWRRRICAKGWPAALALVAATATASSPAPQATSLQYGLFDTVTLTQPAGTPQRSVLLFSDRGGVDAASRTYAHGLAQAGSFVVTVDLDSYLKELESLTDPCSFPAGHVEEMAHWMERHVNLPVYQPPYVVGLGAGADFAYAMSVQAPSGTFSGVATLGYDFDFRLPRAFCTGDFGVATAPDGKAFHVVPVRKMPLPWLAQPFAAGARVNGFLGGIERTFDLQRDATPGDGATLAASLDALNAPQADVVATDDSLSDLPLTEIAPQGPGGHRIAIMLTGDGGWAGLDKGVAAVLSQHGVRVIGLSSLEFFWHRKDAAQITDAVSRIVAHYAARYPDARFVLVGYSFGASLVPVVANRLPDAQRTKISGGVMISPDDTAVFEIHVGDWFGNTAHSDAMPLAPEIAHTRIPLVCVYGSGESDEWCPAAAKLGPVKLVQLPGGHHYDGDYDKLGAAILESLPK
ncbi:MAG TPA: AcvB/VirJ family lysyl-phosphatidylglycerol hydrolase [Rhodanobacteraceae bacterium]|nr:AcvB/VirJ family lysyl-phosphatidylglycerol hydrolase [Rhodanobacteraceae bacterium]